MGITVRGTSLDIRRRSDMPNILTPRALPAGRLAGLDATLAFHHGLLAFHS
jgi:hypothetical protein